MGYKCRPANGERYARAQKRKYRKLQAEAIRKQASVGNGGNSSESSACTQTTGSVNELPSRASNMKADQTTIVLSNCTGPTSGSAPLTGHTSGASNPLTSQTGQTTDVLPSHTGQTSRGTALTGHTSETSNALTSQIAHTNGARNQTRGASNIATSQTSRASGSSNVLLTDVLPSHSGQADGRGRVTGQTSAAINAHSVNVGLESGEINQTSSVTDQAGQVSERAGQTSRVTSISGQPGMTTHAAGEARLTISQTSRVTNEPSGQTILQALLTNQASEIAIIQKSELEQLNLAKAQLLKQISFMKQVINRLQLNEQLFKDNKQILEYYTGEVPLVICTVLF